MNEPETPFQDQNTSVEDAGVETDVTAEQVESDLNVLDDEVSKLAEEKAQIHDQLLRTMADFQKAVDVVARGPIENVDRVWERAVNAYWDGTPTLAHRVTDPGAP